MKVKVICELEWQDGKEIPEPATGSFLILTKDSEIAEAEYRDKQWFQYRWEVWHEDIIAWCRLSDMYNTCMALDSLFMELKKSGRREKWIIGQRGRQD